MTQKVELARVSIGFGCSSNAQRHEIVRLIEASLDPVPPNAILATIDRRRSMGEAVSTMLGLKLALFPAAILAQIGGVTIHSSLALARTRTPSVAEAAALASLGPHARLLVARTQGRCCTCAVAALPREVHS